MIRAENACVSANEWQPEAHRRRQASVTAHAVGMDYQKYSLREARPVVVIYDKLAGGSKHL